MEGNTIALLIVIPWLLAIAGFIMVIVLYRQLARLKNERSRRLNVENDLQELKENNRIFTEKAIKAFMAEDDLNNQLRFGDLIADISARFVNEKVEVLDETIKYSLELCGRFFNVERSYIFMFSKDNDMMSNTHEWCSEGVTPQAENLKDVATESLPWWHEKISNMEYVHIPDVELLPPEADAEKLEFLSQDILSLLCIPMISNGRIIGFFGFDSLKTKRSWTDKEISILKVIAEIFASVIDKKNTLDELMESENRLRQIFENMNEVLLWSGDYFQMQYVSPAYEKVWGRERASLYEDPAAFIEAIYPDDRELVLDAFERHARGEPFDVEYRVWLPEGDIKWVWDRSFPVRNKEDEVVRQTGIAVDITERKIMEIELQKSREEAEAASIAKSRFLANMSHEIRTPFSGIMGIIELLSNTELSEAQSEYITLLKFSTDSLVNIINDILDISKIEAGNMELYEEDFDFKYFINGVVNLFIPVANKKGIAIKVETLAEIPDCVNGDSEKLRQVLSNLLNNAVKFTEKGEINLTVELQEKRDNNYKLLFTVKDTGIGIPEDKLGGIFEPFTQVDNTIQRKYGGTGLGLSITEKLVLMMGGDIGIKSEKGKGTAVVFSVILGDRKGSSLSPDLHLGKKSLSQHSLGRKAHILIVEDNEINQMLTGKTLESTGHSYRIAINGKEAIELFSKEDFDLILMDLQMPEMDGFTATRLIREKELESGTKTPIVALTAHAMPGDREKCLEAGMDYYLSKPLYSDKLVSIIGELLGGKDSDISHEVHQKNESGDYMLREEKEEENKMLDTASLLDKVEGDLDFLDKLLQNFKKSSAELIDDLDKALKERDGKAINFAAHTMKGSLIIFGDEKGGNIAQELEKLGLKEDFKAAEKKIRLLNEEVQKTIESLEIFINKKR